MKTLLCTALLFAVDARAVEVVDCKQAGVGLESVMTPVAKNTRTFYNDKVTVFALDMIEPAAAAQGLAFVVPDKSDESGGAKCFALVGFSRIDLAGIKTSYDSKRGLLLRIPTAAPGGDAAKDGTTQVRIDLSKTSVKLER